MLPSRVCPICRNDKHEPLFDGILEDFDGVAFDKRLFVVCCNDCGFVYNISSNNSENLEQYYQNEALYLTETGFGAGGQTPADKIRYDQYYKSLQPFLTSKGLAIADIGCSKGGFLAFLNDNGLTNIRGVELNPECIEYARTTFNLEVLPGAASSLPFADNQLDIAVFNHVLEHLDDPASVINEARRVVKDGGLIFVEMPNAAGYADARVYDFYWFAIREHINHFDLGHLAMLMERAGFEAVHESESLMPYISQHCYPSLCAIFRKCSERPGKPVLATARLREVVSRYIASESDMVDSHSEKIRDLILNGNPVYPWGIGIEFFSLFSFCGLNKCNIHALVDRNPLKQKRTVQGLPIIPPDALASVPSDATVIITSALHKNQMLQYLGEIGFAGNALCLD